MEPWQKLMQALCEIWVEEDIKSGKNNYEKNADDQSISPPEQHEQFNEAA